MPPQSKRRAGPSATRAPSPGGHRRRPRRPPCHHGRCNPRARIAWIRPPSRTRRGTPRPVSSPAASSDEGEDRFRVADPRPPPSPPWLLPQAPRPRAWRVRGKSGRIPPAPSAPSGRPAAPEIEIGRGGEVSPACALQRSASQGAGGGLRDAAAAPPLGADEGRRTAVMRPEDKGAAERASPDNSVANASASPLARLAAASTASASAASGAAAVSAAATRLTHAARARLARRSAAASECAAAAACAVASCRARSCLSSSRARLVAAAAALFAPSKSAARSAKRLRSAEAAAPPGGTPASHRRRVPQLRRRPSPRAPPPPWRGLSPPPVTASSIRPLAAHGGHADALPLPSRRLASPPPPPSWPQGPPRPHPCQRPLLAAARPRHAT
eukprot:scaffold29841_cov21-Tisochrysis_lutea.AAC.1